MTTMTTFDSASDLPSSEWRAALLAAIEIAEEALEHDALGADVARDLGADAEEMTEERDWIAERRERLDKLRSLLVDPSTSDPLPQEPGARVFDSGHVDTIRPQIPAVVFGRWAAHPSIDYATAAALTVDGGADLASRRVGWVVTHVATGYTLPARLVDGLRQEQAEAIACSLEGAGNCACDLDLAELLQEERDRPGRLRGARRTGAPRSRPLARGLRRRLGSDRESTLARRTRVSPTELDCRSCGACCLSTGDGGDVLHRGYADLTAEDVAQLSPHVRRQLQEVVVCGEVRHATRAKQLPSGAYACRYLRGTPGERCSCAIYSTRPEVCRSFSVGGVACLAARVAARHATPDERIR